MNVPASIRAAAQAALVGLPLCLGALGARAQMVPVPDEAPLASLCRSVIFDPSLTIQLEILSGFPPPNGVSFHVSALDADGGFGWVRVAGAGGESEFGNDTRGSGRPYSLRGSVRPSAPGPQCYTLTYDVTVRIPGAGTRRLAGSTTVKTAKPRTVE